MWYPQRLFAPRDSVARVHAPDRDNAAQQWCMWAEDVSAMASQRARRPVDLKQFATQWAHQRPRHRRRSAIAQASHVLRVNLASTASTSPLFGAEEQKTVPQLRRV